MGEQDGFVFLLLTAPNHFRLTGELRRRTVSQPKRLETHGGEFDTLWLRDTDQRDCALEVGFHRS